MQIVTVVWALLWAMGGGHVQGGKVRAEKSEERTVCVILCLMGRVPLCAWTLSVARSSFYEYIVHE